MSGRGLVYLLIFASVATVLGVCTVRAFSEPAIIVSGRVSASCSTLVHRPLPKVSTVDGEPLDGRAWLSEPLGTGPCSAIFTIDDVPARDAYRVTLASLPPVTVDRAHASGGITLADN